MNPALYGLAPVCLAAIALLIHTVTRKDTPMSASPEFQAVADAIHADAAIIAEKLASAVSSQGALDTANAALAAEKEAHAQTQAALDAANQTAADNLAALQQAEASLKAVIPSDPAPAAPADQPADPSTDQTAQ